MHPSLVPLHAYHYQTRDSNIKSVEVSYMIIMFVVCMMCTVFVLQIENRVLEETCMYGKELLLVDILRSL